MYCLLKNKFIKKIKRLCFLILIGIVVFSCKKESKYVTVSKDDTFVSTNEIPDSHFLGDSKCKDCHKEQFKEWKGSHHDKAMQLADSVSVLGNFSDEKFTSQGVTSHFYKKESGFMVKRILLTFVVLQSSLYAASSSFRNSILLQENATFFCTFDFHSTGRPQKQTINPPKKTKNKIKNNQKQTSPPREIKKN